MSLLTDGQWAQFKGAIKQVTDTFFNIPVTFKKRSSSLSLLSGERSDDTENDIVVNALAIYTTTGDDVSKMVASGAKIDKDGYAVFNFQDITDAGLMDGNNVNLTPNKDSMLFNGLEYEVKDSDPVGPLKDEYALVKVNFKFKDGQVGI